MRHGQRWIVGGLLVAVGLLGRVEASQAFKAPYTPRPLAFALRDGKTVTCRADQAASTGYYRNESGGWDLVAEFEKQSKPATWIITFSGNKGHVADAKGHVGIYLVTRADALGYVLIEPTPGSVQVISIDRTSSSFVYTGQNTTPFYNRANTFTGRCE